MLLFLIACLQHFVPLICVSAQCNNQNLNPPHNCLDAAFGKRNYSLDGQRAWLRSRFNQLH